MRNWSPSSSLEPLGLRKELIYCREKSAGGGGEKLLQSLVSGILPTKSLHRDFWT